MDKKFGGVIWTNHVLKRLEERGLTQSDVWAVWRRPDSARYAQTKGAWIYNRTFGNQKIELVAKRNEKKEWVIMSVWSKTIENYHPKIEKSPLWLKTLRFLFRI